MTSKKIFLPILRLAAKLSKIVLILVMFVVPGMAMASVSKPYDLDDTIPADIRNPNYYYTKWFDECSSYFPNGGVVDNCFCRYYQLHCFYGDPVAKWERAKGRMRVKGLVAMVDRYTSPNAAADSIKLPEYLYLYQLVGRHYLFLQSMGIQDGLDLVLVDSVRWDTATARVMELQRGWNGEHNQYCYLYEAYFENPVYVDSDFYIFGSSNSNVLMFPGSAFYRYTPTVYVDIMDFGGGSLKDGCDIDKYYDICHDECHGQGGYVAITDQQNPEWGWYMPWPDSPWGYYLAIVDQWNLDAFPNDTAAGRVLGGGRFPDDSYDTIEAIPSFGYIFDSWSDGSTENPRVIHLTSDTLFVALFSSTARYDLVVTSSDATMGSVTGSGIYPADADVTIKALHNQGYKFSHWNDGVADNPRVVHIVSDTAFVAYFVEKEYYNVLTATNNDEWGSVEGGGVYMEGEQAELTAFTAPFCIFEGWSDGEWQLPRIVTVTQDTLFTALFSFDSARAAAVDMAGNLDFSVSPNPTTGRLTIQTAIQDEYKMAIFDMQGKEIISKKSSATVTEIDVSMLPAGKYLLIVGSKERYGIRTIVKK